ncbi:uncharacterized protein PHACADRAFT_261560 [Phanerochaete carnosa HHB-10118-sp]|uniref:Uncharacterized protein n=1 Tax=Phanerochaete carnosa (strain HHB-10118-sp) TaxID=650164 RepID=K5USK7_PHACS|nr:uncharacterized protein PHACADRAFT_261560 [Phanerochaete carnosa HHB-10118-sp]EKM52891.1 hypothetical protein PHACADRAFT_261560 [Phanerochaete carnosa HHB-10118-sp]
MSYATGAELPSELLHRIVVLCRAAILSHDGETETFGKKGLAACSLTCRYWAIIIRPKLFETLVLRSYQDAAQLASFLTTPTTLEPSIQEYIRSIEISLCEPARFSETSWVHLVDLCRRIPSLAHNSSITWDRGLNLTMKGVQEGGSNLKQSMRSDTLLPATVLPRTVPVSSLRLKKLVLSDLTLRSVRDLIRFITSLHTWEKASLDIERITFLQGLREADRTQPRRRHGGSNVFMRHCFDKSHFADALRLAIILAGAHSIVEGARGFWLAEQFMLAFPWQDEPEIPAINIWRAKVQGGA